MERLDKFLTNAGVATRSQVKAILKTGRVRVDGAAVKDGAAKIDPEKVAVVRDLDEAYEWICANRSRFAAFATCGARDPELPILAQRIAGGYCKTEGGFCAT